MLLRAVCAAALVGVRLPSAQANAGIDLQWVRDDGAETCISGQTLAQHLAELAAADPQMAGTIAIEGLVRRDAEHARWRARIRAFDAAGQTIGVREVESAAADCAALTPAILLVLSWLLDSREDAPPPAQQPANSAPYVPPPPDEERPPRPSEPAVLRAPPARRFTGELSAGLAGAVGINPAPTFGPSLGALLNTPWRLALALGASYWAHTRVPLTDPVEPGSGVEFSALQASLALCVPLLRPGAWSFAPCWGGVVGARFSRAFGLDNAANPTSVYGGPSGALRLGYGFHVRWAVTLECAGLAFGREDSFTYVDGGGETRVLYEPSRFGGWISLGLAARL